MKKKNEIIWEILKEWWLILAVPLGLINYTFVLEYYKWSIFFGISFGVAVTFVLVIILKALDKK